MLLGDKKYKECDVYFKLNGATSVNDTQIQKNLLDFNVDYLLRAGSCEWGSTHFIV